ncbi:2381_t:CDS:2 [Racocetra persica]|uniref:2381_t:CDS:1 n=1 Tax=Racocetra persica TaxID=160502 RepID=A0ACA9PF00_9GLOM|nr:2381_t:CDS:2 [Racocetra persica]
MTKHTDHKKRISKTQKDIQFANTAKLKIYLVIIKYPTHSVNLVIKFVKEFIEYLTKPKYLRKIFDAKINLLHIIEEAKLIFESLKEQHNFDKLYKVLDNLQDTSDKEKCHNHKRKCIKLLSTNINDCDNCIERQIPCKYKQYKKRGPKPEYKLDLSYHQRYIQRVEKKAQQTTDNIQQKLFKEYLERLKKENQL